MQDWGSWGGVQGAGAGWWARTLRYVIPLLNMSDVLHKKKGFKETIKSTTGNLENLKNNLAVEDFKYETIS